MLFLGIRGTSKTSEFPPPAHSHRCAMQDSSCLSCSWDLQQSVFCFLPKQYIPSLHTLSMRKFFLTFNLKITVCNLVYFFLFYSSQAWKTAQVFPLIPVSFLKTQALLRFLLKVQFACSFFLDLWPFMFLSPSPSPIYLWHFSVQRPKLDAELQLKLNAE